MLQFAGYKNIFLGKNVVYINVGIWRFKKKCLEGCKMQERQDHWLKQNNNHTDMAAVTLMLNSTLSDESVSWHRPISRSNSWKLPYKKITTDLTVEIHRSDRTLCQSWPKEHTLLKYKKKKNYIRSNKITRVAVRKSEIFRLLSIHLIFTRRKRGGADGLGTSLQAGRSRVSFPIGSLGFFIDVILLAALWLLGRLGLRVRGISPGS